MVPMLQKILYSFPVQLLILNLKKNQVLLLCWYLLFAIVTDGFGKVLGIPYLFLDPEYINEVDFWSFFIVGLTIGGFIMAFHITCYIVDSHRFSFLGTLSRPFSRFAVNNSIIPLTFLIVYIISIIRFQIENEFNTNWHILIEVVGVLVGVLTMITFLITYLRLTNKDIFKYIASNVDRQLKKAPISRANVLQRLDVAKKRTIKVDYYIDIGFHFRKVKSNVPYDKEAIIKVFDQNHLNLVLIELIIFLIILLLGIFRESTVFQIPAAASSVLILTIFIMFTGAASYWFRGWSISAVILMLVVLNILIRNEVITSEYQAYGLNYKTEAAEYSLEQLKVFNQPELYQQDQELTINVLNNWKQKFDTASKPKMIFICTSGGGQRSALWSMKTLQAADSITKGAFMKHAMLITGASGGLIGASYYRELFLRKQQGEPINLNNSIYLDNISSDNLNPIIFSLLVNDLFIRYQKFDYAGISYKKDRGYAFEQQLNRNTDFVMDKKLADYKEVEQQGLVPMLFIAPTIINDGRKLFISPHSISYMNTTNIYNKAIGTPEIKGINFQRFFAPQGAENLSFLSALRMSASFPYITPSITLPSDPPMEIMDAGISDNYGISDAINFLYVFKDWIAANTSGVVMVAIRDSEDDEPIEKQLQPSLFQKFFNPISGVYNNLGNIQDINNDSQIEYAQSWYNGSIDCIEFEYITSTIFSDSDLDPENTSVQMQKKKAIERASLNWRLTSREKRNIRENFDSPKNQESLSELERLLE